MTDEEIDKVRREVAAEYHRVALELVMDGTSDVKIVRDDKNMIRRFTKNPDGVISFEDVEVPDGEVELPEGDGR